MDITNKLMTTPTIRCPECQEEIHHKPDGTEVDSREHAPECPKYVEPYGTGI